MTKIASVEELLKDARPTFFITLGIHVIGVSEQPDLEYHGLLGVASLIDHQIILQAGLPKDVRDTTLWHEVWHLLVQIYLSPEEMSHSTVSTLASVSYEALYRNPDMFDSMEVWDAALYPDAGVYTVGNASDKDGVVCCTCVSQHQDA